MGQGTASNECKMLDAGNISEKIPKFAEQLSQRHSPQDWKIVLKKTAEMMINLGRSLTLKPDDFSLIENNVMVSVGDRDTMVSIEETVDVYRKLKKGSLLVLPDTSHPIEKISADRLAYEIKLFFK